MMNKAIASLPLALWLTCAAAPAAFGQSPLQVSVTTGGTTTPVSAGGSLTLVSTGLGQAVSAAVKVSNSGSSPVTITAVSVGGTTEIGLSSTLPLPLTLNPSDTTSFSVQYLPASGNAVTAQVSIAYSLATQASSFLFSLTGTAPRLTFTYNFPPSVTLTALNGGDTIAFPATNLGSSTAVTVNVLNAGTATGSLNAASVKGTGFQNIEFSRARRYSGGPGGFGHAPIHPPNGCQQSRIADPVVPEQQHYVRPSRNGHRFRFEWQFGVGVVATLILDVTKTVGFSPSPIEST